MCCGLAVSTDSAAEAGAPEADIPPDILRRGVEIVDTWETVNTDETPLDLVNRLYRLFSSTMTQD